MYALKVATESRRRSEMLGETGLLRFKEEVEQTVTRTQQIVDFYLGEDVWWQHDPEMDSHAILYAVRLCMGMLAIPLQHAGYIGAHEWREAVQHRYRIRHEKDEQGRYIHPDEAILIPVPSRRFFFNPTQGELSTDVITWPHKMMMLYHDYWRSIGKAEQRIKAKNLCGYKSCRPSYEQTQHSRPDPSFGTLDSFLVVLGQEAALAQPGEGALDPPAKRDQGEAFFSGPWP